MAVRWTAELRPQLRRGLDRLPEWSAICTGTAAPAAEPTSIEKGMTPDQVEAALGKPDKKVNLGSKQLYIYKDMKVTFLNGKVSDVQ